MDHQARGATWTMTANTLTGGANAQGRVGLVDGRHHVGAGVDKGAAEVIGRGRRGVERLGSLLVLGVVGTKTGAKRIGPCGVLGTLVGLRLGRLCLVSKKEWSGWYGSCAGLELAECASAVVEEFKSLDELVGHNLGKPVVGDKEGILHVAKRVSEEDGELVDHLYRPEDQRLVGPVALLETRSHRRQ